MSDFGGDIDDELLELAGAGDNKRKRRQSSSKSSSSKRRKADVSDSDEPESEDDQSNPYPLEGKYKDEEDRNRLMEMSEIDREDELAQRQEELQRLKDKRDMDILLKNQGNMKSAPVEDSVSKAAKRQHTSRGFTKEKNQSLDVLKAKRKAKDEKKRTKTNSPKRERDRSSSPMDMDISDDEEEDGQITKYEEEEEEERKLLDKDKREENPTLEDLEKCRLSRDMLAKHCMASWFQEYVKGAWVRYLIGNEGNEPVYRACEISNLAPDLVKPYKINDTTVNQAFELKHGKSTRVFNMDKVSNSPFTPKEFSRLMQICSVENVKQPPKRMLQKKAAELLKLSTQPMTENDISAMLARKNLLANKVTSAGVTLERSRLAQARTLAQRRHDFTEVKVIDAQLAALADNAAAAGVVGSREETADLLTKVNERNRKANLESIRKAELAEAERKKREREKKIAVSATSTPLGLKPLSRPSTPGVNGAALRPITPLPPSALSGVPIAAGQTFESSVVAELDVDLGDF